LPGWRAGCEPVPPAVATDLQVPSGLPGLFDRDRPSAPVHAESKQCAA
jgi:hypothetical protein